MPSKKVWNLALSTFDPEAQEFFGRRLAAALPSDNPIRSTLVGRVIGLANSWLESLADEVKSPLAGALLEKLTDYVDFFSTCLHSEGGSTATAEFTGEDWMGRFFTEAGKRLQKATDPRAEAEKIKAEFQFRQELFAIIDAARRANAPAKTEPKKIDWAQMQNRLKAILVTVDRVAEKAAGPVGKLADKLEGMRGGKR